MELVALLEALENTPDEYSAAGEAGKHAAAVEAYTRGGGVLGPDGVARIARIVRTVRHSGAPRSLARALLDEGCRLRDGGPIETLAGMPTAVVDALQMAAQRDHGGDAIITAFARIIGPNATTRERTSFTSMLEARIAFGHDVLAVVPWLLAQLELPRELGWHGKRVDGAAAAARVLVEALRQANGTYRLYDEDAHRAYNANPYPGVIACPDREAFQAAARQRILPALEPLLARPSVREDARSVLVAIAADDQRWNDLDALIDATPADELTAVERGLAIALDGMPGTLTMGTKISDPHAPARVAGIVARAARIRRQLAEPDRDRLDAATREATKRLALPNHARAATSELVERLLRASAPERWELVTFLHEELRAAPGQHRALPALADVPASGPRDELVALHARAIAQRDDIEATRQLLAEVDRLGLSPEPIASSFGHGRPATGPYIELLAPLLDHPDTRARRAAVDVLTLAASQRKVDLATWAGSVLRSTIDRDPIHAYGSMARVGLDLAVAALAATTRRESFVDAARELVRDLDHGRITDLAPQLRKLFPDEHAALVSGKAPARRPAHEAEMLATIWARPDDDDARLVYADALLEVGDARGELIVVQCERARVGGPPTPRERALLRVNTRAWLGRMTAVLVPESIVLERGFLVACTFEKLDLRERDVSLGHAAWKTVEALGLGRSLGVRLERLLGRLPRLRSLAVAERDLDDIVTRLANASPTLATVSSAERTFVRENGSWSLSK